MDFFLKTTLRQVALLTTANLAGFGGFLIYYIPNTIGLEKTKEVTQIYSKESAPPLLKLVPFVLSIPVSNACVERIFSVMENVWTNERNRMTVESVRNELNLQPTTVSDDLEQIKDKVMKDMQISEEMTSQVELYHLYGFTPFTFGSTWKPPIFQGFNRALIGIPLNYCQEDKIFRWKDIVIMEKGQGKQINWASADGRQLREALTLSDKAKKFAIAQQIYRASTSEVISKATITWVMFPLAFAMAKTINERGNLFQKPQKLRFAMYTIVALFNLTLWVFLKDLLICNVELNSDEAVAALGKDYVEGGVEYYNKQLSTNQSLRTILGKKGEKLYTLFGNENTFLRQKHVPITQRRDFFNKKLEDQPQNIELVDV